MKYLIPGGAILLALGIHGAAAQQAAPLPQEDCAFLEYSFQQVYDGMREHRRDRKELEPALVGMYVGIQNNIILMHTARGCDVSKLIRLARDEAAKYVDRK